MKISVCTVRVAFIDDRHHTHLSVNKEVQWRILQRFKKDEWEIDFPHQSAASLVNAD